MHNNVGYFNSMSIFIGTCDLDDLQNNNNDDDDDNERFA